MRFKLVIWKLLPCFQNSGWLQPTNLNFICNQHFWQALKPLSSRFVQMVYYRLFFYFFCFQDLFSKFSNLLFVLVPGGWPWEHLLFSFDQDRTSKSNGENNHRWSALSALKFDKKEIISFRKKIKYEPGSWNFFNFIISLWNVKQMFWDNSFIPFAHNSCYSF